MIFRLILKHITLANADTQVLQAVCDADLRFIDCFVGYPGSVADIRVFRNSDLWHAVHENKNNFFPGEEFIIGDKAYPILGWCLPPYRDNGHLTRVRKWKSN